ncbi:hypothetical protein COB57_01825 [Candidatus Peregrinibacteria bacterium]|nr:MAG: hypothetical protein COB57_01825 [Candidatus Peregrinibacteria bacterium]
MKKINILFTFMLISSFAAFTHTVSADFSTPHSINYQGVIYDAQNQSIATPLDFRFSLWSDSNFNDTDVLENGDINIEAEYYSEYEETQTLTPDNNNSFHTAIGSKNELPQLQYDIHKFLQIEIKRTDAPESDYEILDIDSDITNSTDRRALNSSAYAINADSVDNRSVGTESGDIAILNESAQFDMSVIPNSTNKDTFTLNADNSETSAVRIFFDSLLGKAISWINNRFEISDSLFVFGNFSNSGNTVLGDGPDDTASVSGNFYFSGTINDRDFTADMAKLDSMEEGATRDQDATEVSVEIESFQSDNVHDALLGLKNLIETNNKTIAKLEDRIEKLEARHVTIFSHPVSEPVSGEWTEKDNGYYGYKVDGSAISLFTDATHQKETIITTTLIIDESTSWRNGFIIFDYKNEKNFKYIGMRAGADYWTVGEYKNNTFKNLKNNAEEIPDNENYDIQVTISGKDVTLRVNEVEKIQYTFKNNFNETLGMVSENSGITFSDMSIETSK